jgi:hypothetical protein
MKIVANGRTERDNKDQMDDYQMKKVANGRTKGDISSKMDEQNLPNE